MRTQVPSGEMKGHARPTLDKLTLTKQCKLALHVACQAAVQVLYESINDAASPTQSCSTAVIFPRDPLAHSENQAGKAGPR